MIRIFYTNCLAVLFCFTACRTVQNRTTKDDGKIEVVFVQVNDVYEIAPLSGGKEGGMARVATLKKQQQQANSNTFLFMAGDFVSPSVFNSLQYEGKAVRGKQMIEAMNAAGMDFVVFGNHEFDIKENELQERINESDFQWIASNTFLKLKDTVLPFSKTGVLNSSFPKYHILKLADSDGTSARVGIIGLTLPANRAAYVQYTDAITEAKNLYNLLKDSVDAMVALTHQSVQEDVQLAKEVPGLALILGGHEHDQQFEKEGKVFITKAHANARSAYVVKMQINTKRDKVKVKPELVYLNQNIALDSATNVVVQKWNGIADNNFGKLGFDARKAVISTGEPLEGRETEIRQRSTNLSRLIVAAMEAAAPSADVSLFNSGSIRVDDVLQLPVTQYDIIRALPFGGGIREVDMKGSLLKKILDAGRKNRGNGGFLQYSESVSFNDATSSWSWKTNAIEDDKIYRVAISEFLLTGQETNLDFLNVNNKEIVKIYVPDTVISSPQSDIRLAVIRYLEKGK